MRLNQEQAAAVTQEIDRLHYDCDAVELAPPHDSDKALTKWAQAYERQPFPRGSWPVEQPVPVLPSHEITSYDLKQSRICAARRRKGLPFRDFEQGVFPVAKSDGGWRVCTDYRNLNKNISKTRFQMEGIEQVAHLIQPNDFGMLIDLKDCYLTLGLHPAHRKYCRFRCPTSHKRYQWKTVSFGTSEAPKICTKILKPLIQILKSLGIRALIYIDDLLLLDQDRIRLARAMAIAMDLLQRKVGLQLKISKGQLVPSQTFTCLGTVWNTQEMKCFMPPKRIKAIQHTARRLLSASTASPTSSVKTKDLARFVGQVVSTTRAIRPAKRRLLFIQHSLSAAVRKSGWIGTATLSPEATNALRWWVANNPWVHNGNEIVPPIRPIQITVRSDAATHNAGYGGELIYKGKAFQTRGFLTKAEQKEKFINEFEFSGMANTVRALLPLAIPDKRLWAQVHIAAELDNTAAIKYGQVAVSRSLNMSKKGAEFHDWREKHGLEMSFRHLAGVLNITSDELSRRQSSHIDWMLHHTLFQRACKIFRAKVKVDLFASAWNSQVHDFYSFHHDHRARGADSFQFQWNQLGTVYAYPPPILMGRVLQKALMERVPVLILVAPLWQAQPWWPTLLSMASAPPLLLPNEPWITEDQMGNQTWPCRWPLAVWRLFGNTQQAKACRLNSFSGDGTRRRTSIRKHMMRISIGSSSGGSLPTTILNSVLQTYDLVI